MSHHSLSVPVSSPLQQISAVVATRDFLMRLATRKFTPSTPREIRCEARTLLRHYPHPDKLRPVLEAGLRRDEREDVSPVVN